MEINLIGGPWHGQRHEWDGAECFVLEREQCAACGGDWTKHVYEVVPFQTEPIAQWKGIAGV